MQPPSQPLPSPMAGFHPDVENVVNGYFESLFSGQLSPEDLINALRNLKTSSTLHERQIHDCLIRNLFEEFKFFPNYPEKELETVAVFVGQIIASDILHPTSQSTALSFILEAMKKPVGSRLFQFAQLSLVHFYRRIPEWLQFMESLTKSPHYEFLPEIVRSHLTNAHRDDFAASSEHIDSLRAALSSGPVKEPPEKLRERIHFAINNLTEDNVKSKAEDIQGLLLENNVNSINEISTEYYQWFVEYFMSDRVILESNLHPIYHDLLICIGAPGLLEQFMSTSLAKARRLLLSFESLPSERRDSIQLRSILKNLAQWLGLLFFSRDRPILRRELCFKSLLTAQIGNDYYTFVLPFTCKFLEKSTLSSVFLPTNPWMSSILRLLLEIYLFVDLKLNSKFEIELLFKSLGIDMKSVQPANILRRKMSRNVFVTSAGSIRPSSGLPSVATVNELALAEIGSAQIDRICAIAAKTLATLLQKDATALGGTVTGRSPETAAGIASVLFEASSREAIRSILFATYRKYFAAAGISIENEGRLFELVEKSYPTVIVAAHELITKNMAGRALSQSISSSPPGLPVNSSVASVYSELSDAVINGRTVNISMAINNSTPSGSNQPHNVHIHPQQQKDISTTVASLLSEIENIAMSKSSEEIANVSQLEDEGVKNLMKRIVALAASETNNRDEACLLISQKLVQVLFRSSSSLMIDISIVLLAKVFEYSARVSKEVTNWILMSSDERKFNVAAMSGLLSSGLVYVLDFDVQLSRQIETATNSRSVVSFAIQLIRRCVLASPQPIAAPYDLVYSLEALGRVLKRSVMSTNITNANTYQLNQEAKDIMGLMGDISKRISEPTISSDAKMREVVSFWFSDWFRLCQYPSDTSKQVSSFLSQLSQKDTFFKRSDKTAAFFRICSEVAVELFLHQKHAPSVLSLRGVECYVKLSIGLATWSSSASLSKSPKSSTMVGDSELLRIALCEFSSVLLTALPQQPIVLRALSRLLNFTLSELCGLAKGESGGDGNLLTCSNVISDLLDALNPIEFPSSLAAWIEAVSSKYFLSLWLFEFSEDGAAVVGRVLQNCVEFLSQPEVVSSNRTPSLATAYQAILRLFVGIAHDRPELLLSLSKDLLMRLDSHYIQLRNLLLATIPNSMILPDPFSADFSFEQVSFAANQPAIDFLSRCHHVPLKLVSIDPQILAFTEASVSKCITGVSFDCEAFIRLHSGPHKYLAFSSSLYGAVSHKAPLVGVERLAEGLSKSIKGMLNEGIIDESYHLLFALVDNLRFPCTETIFFVQFFLSLFKNSSENIRELITRVLLERLIVHKPHPWGLIVAFLEIIKRPDFWKCHFTSKTPEIRRMFESVAKTCGNVMPSHLSASKPPLSAATAPLPRK